MLLHLVPPKFDPNFFSYAFLGDASTFCTHDISSNDIFQTFLWHSPHPPIPTGHSMIAQLFGDYSQKVVLLQGILKGNYHCTIDLLFDWFGLICFANKNKSCQLSYSWFQTSLTGGQPYSDTSPFSIPWLLIKINQLPVSVVRCQHGSWRSIETFIQWKIPKFLVTPLQLKRDYVYKHRLGNLVFLENFDVCLTKFKNIFWSKRGICVFKSLISLCSFMPMNKNKNIQR
jgi:hypothetical protein